MQYRRKLPSLTALVALEATIRNRSMTVAARELGVTQAAVSRQIALLEEEFGRPLFIRRHRQIEPTPSCMRLGNALSDSLSNISTAVETFHAKRTEVVTIGATIAFSAMWLLPKIAEFRSAYPGVQIRVVSQEGKFSLDAEEVDIAIRYGNPPFDDGTVVASCGDRIFPVCSPDYANRLVSSIFPQPGLELIETEFSSRSWYRWADWFVKTGRRQEFIEPSLRFSHYTETIAAAKAGQGVALGWETLISSNLEDGSLVKLGDIEFVAEGRHNILVPTDARRSAVCDLVCDWLTAALQQSV